MFKFVCVVAAMATLAGVNGHGMLLDPPNRSSLWRFDDSAPINYNDNELFCGGANVQWSQNGGNCGVCGDNYAWPHPQPNENTGTYGQGRVVANYTAGQLIETRALLTANHLGFFSFSLCELSSPDAPESGESCFKPLKFEDGSYNFQIYGDDYMVTNRVQLPEDFKCERCVLRWNYRGGNNWGMCPDGSSTVGCGPQETFRSCADISIV